MGAFDSAIRGYARQWASPWGEHVMFGITELGYEWLMVPVGLMLFWWLTKNGRRHEAILFAVTTLSAEAASQILKPIFHRHRPEPFFGIHAPTTYSFPSGHAFIGVVYYTMLAAAISRRALIRVAGILVGVVIGLSRIYLGVHFPSDVAAGFALGVFWLAMAWLSFGGKWSRSAVKTAFVQPKPASLE
jgi:undecaprenyl-diphosphatase